MMEAHVLYTHTHTRAKKILPHIFHFIYTQFYRFDNARQSENSATNINTTTRKCAYVFYHISQLIHPPFRGVHARTIKPPAPPAPTPFIHFISAIPKRDIIVVILYAYIFFISCVIPRTRLASVQIVTLSPNDIKLKKINKKGRFE